jgi:aminopeptidase N
MAVRLFQRCRPVDFQGIGFLKVRKNRRALLCSLAIAIGVLNSPQAVHAENSAAQPMRSFDVLHYEARLDPDLSEKKLRGRVLISLVTSVAGLSDIGFDAGDLKIDAVRERGKPLSFEKIGEQLLVRLPAQPNAGAKHDVEIYYHGSPSFGLEFHPERSELYTIFSTSQWLVCVDAPEERATLDLSVALPTGFKAVGNGRLVSKTALDQEHALFRWRQDVPVPSFVFGFVAGKYLEALDRIRGVTFRYLSSDRQPAQLRRIFGDTADMLKYFGNRAGVRYRGSYTQALVTETVGQEEANFALMSEAYGNEVLENPLAESLIAHEAAHQWWGIMITNRDWKHFWLIEGFAVFMAASYIQYRFGEEEYQKYVDRWRQRIDLLRSKGTDHGLIYDQWLKPSADDRAVVYQKGAYVLHLLRHELGDSVFWRGIREYSQANYGKSVKTDDFRHAMEHASRRDLSAFFARWADGPIAGSDPLP